MKIKVTDLAFSIHKYRMKVLIATIKVTIIIKYISISQNINRICYNNNNIA